MSGRKLWAAGFIGMTICACNELLGNTEGVPVDSACDWLGDECNCYQRFAAGVAPGYSGRDEEGKLTFKSGFGEPRCGVFLNDANEAVDSATGNVIDSRKKSTFGVFLSRTQLDTCVLTGSDQGGQVIFNPPLDLTTFPPSAISFQRVDRFGNWCARGTFEASTHFSIEIAPPDEDENTGSNLGLDTCSSTAFTSGSSGEAITQGSFSMAPANNGEVVIATCPNGESYTFSLAHLDKCDGSGEPADEANFKALFPSAQVDTDAGSSVVNGYVRFRVFWPPTATSANLNGQTPVGVEYFHCTIPAEHCFDGILNDNETDIDCGGTCIFGCGDSKTCITGTDCMSKVCKNDANGFLKCAAPQCGDMHLNGLDQCDDGNTLSGDGCSTTCQEEAGYRCDGAGACQEIDECAEGNSDCPAGTCVNTPGSFTCACDPGSAWDGTTCLSNCGNGSRESHEQCDDGNITTGDGCSANCTVESGFVCVDDGASCSDIDECAGGGACLSTQTCANEIGSFTCTCNDQIAKLCGNDCLDVTYDVLNCGDCDVVCPPNQGCFNGTCCPPPANTLCDGMCTDTLTSKANCGACGNACTLSYNCISGLCCPPPANAVCNGTCTDTKTDDTNCGTCGKACMLPQTCLNGLCI